VQLERSFKSLNPKYAKHVSTYAEKISGFKSEDERPEMKKLIESVDRGELTDIWVLGFDRLSRNAINLQNIVQHCVDRGVNIYFKNQDVNSLSRDGKYNDTTKLIISVLSIFAEIDANNFKEKGIQGKISKAKQGNYVGGQLQLGYKYINDIDSKTKKIVVDESRKLVVEYIFNAYVNEAKSLGQITNELNNLTLIKPEYKPASQHSNKKIDNIERQQWAITTIKRIIECTMYSEGYTMFKGEKILLSDDIKFIESDIWSKANELLTTNKTFRKERTHEYLFKDIIYCSCGNRMQPQQKTKNYVGSDNSKIVGFYNCKDNIIKRINKSVTCQHNTRSVKTETLENAIWLLIKNKLPEFKQSIEQIAIKQDEIRSMIEQNIQLIDSIKNNRIGNLRNERQRTIETFRRFGGEPIDSQIKRLDLQIKEQDKIISGLNSVNSKLSFSIDNLDVVSEIERNIKIIEGDKNLIKLYLNKLVSKIIVHGGLDGEMKTIIEIVWNENINNNNNTFLFYYSRDSILYFFIYGKDHINITWKHEKKLFLITDSEINETNEISVDELIIKLTLLYNDKKEKEHPEFQYKNYYLYVKYKDPLKQEQIDKLKKKFGGNSVFGGMYFDDLDEVILKFPVDCGVAPLQIVTPFE
ncbi:MAG: recombinase family protein, partial [Paludibacter sp.]